MPENLAEESGRNGEVGRMSCPATATSNAASMEQTTPLREGTCGSQLVFAVSIGAFRIIAGACRIVAAQFCQVVNISAAP